MVFRFRLRIHASGPYLSWPPENSMAEEDQAQDRQDMAGPAALQDAEDARVPRARQRLLFQGDHGPRLG